MKVVFVFSIVIIRVSASVSDVKLPTDKYYKFIFYGLFYESLAFLLQYFVNVK